MLLRGEGGGGHGGVPGGARVVVGPVAEAIVRVEDQAVSAVHGVGGARGADEVLVAGAVTGVETVLQQLAVHQVAVYVAVRVLRRRCSHLFYFPYSLCSCTECFILKLSVHEQVSIIKKEILKKISSYLFIY